MIFETANLEANEIYRLLNGGVTPRPIAWISTLSVDGVANLAPYSFFNVARQPTDPLVFTSKSENRAGQRYFAEFN